MRLLLCSDGHWWQPSRRRTWPRNCTSSPLGVHQFAAKSHDLGLLQFNDLGLLLEFQLHHGVLVGGRCRGQRVGCRSDVQLVLAVDSQRCLQVVNLSASLAQFTSKLVNFFDQRHVLLKNTTFLAGTNNSMAVVADPRSQYRAMVHSDFSRLPHFPTLKVDRT